MKKDTIVVSIDVFNDLLKDQDKLRALEQAGVDNWEGYSIAMEILHSEYPAEAAEEEEID